MHPNQDLSHFERDGTSDDADDDIGTSRRYERDPNGAREENSSFDATRRSGWEESGQRSLTWRSRQAWNNWIVIFDGRSMLGYGGWSLVCQNRRIAPLQDAGRSLKYLNGFIRKVKSLLEKPMNKHFCFLLSEGNSTKNGCSFMGHHWSRTMLRKILKCAKRFFFCAGMIIGWLQIWWR